MAATNIFVSGSLFFLYLPMLATHPTLAKLCGTSGYNPIHWHTSNLAPHTTPRRHTADTSPTHRRHIANTLRQVKSPRHHADPSHRATHSADRNNTQFFYFGDTPAIAQTWRTLFVRQTSSQNFGHTERADQTQQKFCPRQLIGKISKSFARTIRNTNIQTTTKNPRRHCANPLTQTLN
jgi:hypothetical protein